MKMSIRRLGAAMPFRFADKRMTFWAFRPSIA